MNKALILLAAIAMPTAAFAAEPVSIQSKVLVEKTVLDASGKSRTVQQNANAVVPGDKIVIMLNYKNSGDKAVNDFTVTNPVPNGVEFVSVDSADAVVTVDNSNWGPLGSLKVKGSNGAMRSATASDVKGVRWTLSKPIPAGASGNVSFRGLVR